MRGNNKTDEEIMQRQYKIAFFIGIISIMVLDVCWITARNDLSVYIFTHDFIFYKLFHIDYWYHFALVGIFLTFILLLNGKGEKNVRIEKNI